MKKTLILAAVGLALAAGSATAQPGGTCLRTQNLRNHTIGDDHTLYFDYNGREVYRLTTSNNCLAAATSSDPIVLKDMSQGMMCKPIDWDLSVRGSRCIVTGMSKLTPQEVAALPKGKRP
jgi:hypothetical protein